MKKVVVISLLACASIVAFAAGKTPGKDDDGNTISKDTPLWKIEQRVTDIGNLADVIAPNYDSISNKAETAVQPTTVTNVVREAVYVADKYAWDRGTSVVYKKVLLNNYLYYDPVTNATTEAEFRERVIYLEEQGE